MGASANVTGGNYPTVSNINGVTEGPLVLQLRSVAGFLFTNAGPGVGGGGSATEYTEDFNSLSLNGQGSTYLNVVGGRDLLQFDTNLETNANALANFGMTPARFADIAGTFTVKPPPIAGPGTLPWTVSSNDPLLGTSVPEPASVLSGLACLFPILGSVLGRNRRRKSA